MCLLKFLQHTLAPARWPWYPSENVKLVRLIHEIVLAEESDIALDGRCLSHFSMYGHAMAEVGGDPSCVENFARAVAGGEDLATASAKYNVPAICQRFIQTTFSFMNPDKPYLAAAAFALGREKVIPIMFQGFLENIGVDFNKAKHFRFYLERHVQIDGDEHGPLALEMVQELCGSDEQKWQAAGEAAVTALQARIQLWDGVRKALLPESPWHAACSDSSVTF